MRAKNWKKEPHPPGCKTEMHTPEALEIVLKLASPHSRTYEEKTAVILVADLLAGYNSARNTSDV